MAEISLSGVNKAYGSTQVLHDVAIDIEDGQFCVFVGPSGCGKSTLLRVIAGLESVTDGEVRIGGEVVNDSTPPERGIAMVFQSYALYPHMTVYRNMAFGLKMGRAGKADMDARVREAARVLQLEELLGRRPSQLSGGQRQRVAIGRALVRDAAVLLFDEPLSNLDAALRAELRVKLKRLHQALTASTMVYVTHDQVEAMTLADGIAVMNIGVIEQLDTPRSVYKHPNSRFVAGFVGSPKTSFVTENLTQRTGQWVSTSDAFGQSLEGYAFRDNAAGPLPAELDIRPEVIRLVSSGSGAGAAADVGRICRTHGRPDAGLGHYQRPHLQRAARW